MFNRHALLMAVFAVAACAANPPHTGAPATASSAAASAEVPFHASPRLDLHCTPNSATEEATCVAQPAHYLVPERFNNGPVGADERGYFAEWTAGTLTCRCTSQQEEERLVPFQAPSR